MTPDQRAALASMKGLVVEGDGLALYDMARTVPADQAIVEVGAHRGLSTCWIALGAADGHGAHVWSIDPWPWEGDPSERVTDVPWAEAGAREEWQTHIDAVGMTDQVTPIRGRGGDVGATWTGPPVGMLFHDADHSYEAVRGDYLAWLPHLAPGAWVAVHDYWGAIPDGAGGWRRIGTVQKAVRKIIVPSGKWTDVDEIGQPFDVTTPNLWVGRRS